MKTKISGWARAPTAVILAAAIALSVSLAGGIPARAASAASVIFIGDSRTVGMKSAITSSQRNRAVWSCKVGAGLSWAKRTGVPAVEGRIGRGSRVVILLGVNDIGYKNSYVSYINQKAASWTKKGAKVCFVSVNPVQDSRSRYVKNYHIRAFNARLRSGLRKVTYIDTNSALSFKTVDGIHYNTATYRKIYNYIMSRLPSAASSSTTEKGATTDSSGKSTSLAGWRVVNGVEHYYNASGKIVTGWITLWGNCTYYLDPKTGVKAIGWRVIDGGERYFRSNGVMVRGWITLWGHCTYYLDPSSGIKTVGWRKISGRYSYFAKNGVMVKSRWLTRNGHKVYVNSSGYMLTGTHKIGSRWHKFNSYGYLVW